MDINKALSLLSDRNGSELFVTVGYPPCLKINNQLVAAGSTPLTSEQVQLALQKLMGGDRYQSFCQCLESNYAFQHAEAGRFRVSAFFQKGEPGMVVRRIHHHIPTMDELGLPAHLGDQILQERGLILITGAAGSGKSTSMAALVNHRNQQGQGHIITIEDPIEFIHSHQGCIVTQREVGLDTTSYAEGLANALRQAPDLVVIGEIRSPQVMRHTLDFVETGHLCIATLHANNAYQALERVIHFFPQEQHSEVLLDLSLSIRAVIGQQLIPSEKGDSVWVAHEVLLNSPAMAELVKKGRIDEINELMERSAEEGMQSTDQAVFRLFKTGRISADQALLHANSANNMRLMIKMAGHSEGGTDTSGIDQLRVCDD
ncbi:MAG: PilT/PilU family type 4a pilus ATPase [Endozoicomonas sp.]